jgi:hypothetical protein
MTFVILIGTAILLSAGYAVAAAMPGCVSNSRLAESTTVRAIVLLYRGGQPFQSD